MFREVWALAIEALCWVELRGFSERLALTKASKTLGFNNPSALGFAHKLILETVRSQNFLDHLLNQALQPDSISTFPPNVRAFLRIYAYQTKVMGRDSYEKAAAMARAGRSVLGWRRLKNAEEALGTLLGVKSAETLNGLSDDEKVSLQMFQPLWFVKYCFKLLGRHKALQYFESTLSNTPTYIRLNTLRTTEEKALERISSEGVCVERVEGLPYSYRLINTRKPLSRTSSFSKGLFFIQDKASCLASEVASLKTGMTVLDVCAAPGAKTTHIAQLMGNRGRIYSVDYSQRRIRVWARETHRMGVEIAMPLVGDACNPLPIYDVQADVVFLDPPCTSTGAFSRAPSAKWRLSKRSITGMAKLQWKMMKSSAVHVKTNGSLVYSTCSITIEENEFLVERFLKRNPNFTLAETEPRIGLPGMRGLSDCQRLYPHLHECNGFFIAKLERRG